MFSVERANLMFNVEGPNSTERTGFAQLQIGRSNLDRQDKWCTTVVKELI